MRLIVDMRRSGVNGKMRVFERVVLPRISDVADCLKELLKHARAGEVPEFYIVDFSDAFYTLGLHPDEQAHTVVKGFSGGYFVLKSVCFGLCCGPLVWGRLAAAFMRLGQATMTSREGRSQCYVDDPLLIAIGSSSLQRSKVFARVTLLWCALGASLAWKKVSRGPCVEWIGVLLQLEGPRLSTLRVTLTQEKTTRLFELFTEIIQEGKRGVIAVRTLSQAAGVVAALDGCTVGGLGGGKGGAGACAPSNETPEGALLLEADLLGSAGPACHAARRFCVAGCGACTSYP